MGTSITNCLDMGPRTRMIVFLQTVLIVFLISTCTFVYKTNSNDIYSYSNSVLFSNPINDLTRGLKNSHDANTDANSDTENSNIQDIQTQHDNTNYNIYNLYNLTDNNSFITNLTSVFLTNLTPRHISHTHKLFVTPTQDKTTFSLEVPKIRGRGRSDELCRFIMYNSRGSLWESRTLELILEFMDECKYKNPQFYKELCMFLDIGANIGAFKH